ncbi:MAG: hypothetical protein ABUS57_14980 [Pseudomonadota bacterium]
MVTGRRSSDWLRVPSASAGEGERRAGDRRDRERRTPRRRLDPLFAATLINQVAPAETPAPFAYGTAPPALRRGVVVNFRV